jgi:xanthine dehydrogenase YagR molybdenum-binding subunit
MKFDTPATTNPIDQLKVVGQPLDRIDGRLKTTGTAPYAYEQHDACPEPAYGYVLGAGHRQGTHHRHGAERGQGRAGACWHRHRRECRQARQGQVQHGQAAGRPAGRPLPPGDRVVVAETFEQARAAALVIRWITRTEGRFDLARRQDLRLVAPTAARAAAHRTRPHRATSRPPSRPRRSSLTRPTPRPTSHAMMEPHASIAAWDGDSLTGLDLQPDDRLGPPPTWPRRSACHKEKVRLISPFIGGGFGGKLFLRADAVLAASAPARPAAGEGGAAAAADDEQHHAPARDHPAHPHGRDAGRQDHRDRA